MSITTIDPNQAYAGPLWQPDQAVFDLGFSRQLQDAAETITDIKQISEDIIQKNDEQVPGTLTLEAVHDTAIGIMAGGIVGSVAGAISAVEHCTSGLDGSPLKALPCGVLYTLPYMIGGTIIGGLTGKYVGSHQLATAERSIARDVKIGTAAGMAVGVAVGLKGLHQYKGIESIPELVTTAAAGTVIQAWVGAAVGSVSGLFARIASIRD